MMTFILIMSGLIILAVIESFREAIVDHSGDLSKHLAAHPDCPRKCSIHTPEEYYK